MRSTPHRALRTLALALVGCGLLVGCASTGGSEAQSSPSELAPGEVNCQEVHCVALTFDDGPGQYTDELLDVLGEHDSPATFFVLGKNVANYPETLARMVEQGHQIGSHSYDHKDITTLTREGIEHEVQWTNEAVQEAAGVTPQVFRPPYGAHGAVYDRLIPAPLVLWDVDTEDWLHRDAKKTVETAMAEVKPGSIILMHDIHQTSVDAVPELVEKLEAAGYQLVTVEQLFAHADFANSKAYTRLEMVETEASAAAGE